MMVFAMGWVCGHAGTIFKGSLLGLASISSLDLTSKESLRSAGHDGKCTGSLNPCSWGVYRMTFHPQFIGTCHPTMILVKAAMLVL